MRFFILLTVFLTGLTTAHANQSSDSADKNPCQNLLAGSLSELVAHVMQQDFKSQQNYTLRGGVEQVNPELISKMQQASRRFEITVSDPKITLVDRNKMAMTVEIAGPGKNLIQALMDLQEVLPEWNWMREAPAEVKPKVEAEEKTKAKVRPKPEPKAAPAPTVATAPNPAPAPLPPPAPELSMPLILPQALSIPRGMKSVDKILEDLKIKVATPLHTDKREVMIYVANSTNKTYVDAWLAEKKLKLVHHALPNLTEVLKLVESWNTHTPHLVTIGVPKQSYWVMSARTYQEIADRIQSAQGKVKVPYLTFPVSEWVSRLHYRNLIQPSQSALSEKRGLAVVTWEDRPAFVVVHGRYLLGLPPGKIGEEIKHQTGETISASVVAQIDGLRQSYLAKDAPLQSVGLTLGAHGRMMFALMADNQRIGVFVAREQLSQPAQLQDRLIVVPIATEDRNKASKLKFSVNPDLIVPPEVEAEIQAARVLDRASVAPEVQGPPKPKKPKEVLVMAKDGVRLDQLVADRAELEAYLIRNHSSSIPAGKEDEGRFEILYSQKSANKKEVFRVEYSFTGGDDEMSLIEVSAVTIINEKEQGEFWKRTAAYFEISGGTWEAKDEDALIDVGGKLHDVVLVPGAVYARLMIVNNLKGAELDAIISKVQKTSSLGNLYGGQAEVDGKKYQVLFLLDHNGQLRLANVDSL